MLIKKFSEMIALDFLIYEHWQCSYDPIINKINVMIK